MRRIALLLGALLTVASASVAVPASGAPPTVVSATNPDSIALASPGMVLVQSVTITKGTWTLIGKASLINAGTDGDFFRCELVDATHSTVLDGSTAFLNMAIRNDVIANVAVLTVTARVTISQECGHDGTAGDLGGFVDGESNLVGFASAPSRVRSARSGGQTALNPSVDTGVLNLSLPAGSWVVVAKVTPVVLSAVSVRIVCSDEAVSGGQDRELGTGGGEHAVSTIFAAGALQLKKPKTVHLNCAAGGSGAYIDPGAVLYAWKATALKRALSATCPIPATAATATDALVATQVGQCELISGTRSSPLLHAQLKAGTWVALGGPFDLASKGLNVARCELYDQKKMLLFDSSGASTSASVLGFPTTGLANLAVVRVTRARALDGDCGEDNVGADAVSSAASWVFLRP